MPNDKFLQDIEAICIENDMNYIDAIVHWCQKHNIDVDLIADYVKKDSILKDKIKNDAENLNFMKKGARLPI